MNLELEKKQLIQEVEKRRKWMFKFLFFWSMIFYPVFLIFLYFGIFYAYYISIAGDSIDGQWWLEVYWGIFYVLLLALFYLWWWLLKTTFDILVFKSKWYSFDLSLLDMDYSLDLLLWKEEVSEYDFWREVYLLLLLDMIEIQSDWKVLNLTSNIWNDMW